MNRRIANIGLIDLTARYALNCGFHVAIEGVLCADHYGEMLALGGDVGASLRPGARIASCSTPSSPPARTRALTVALGGVTPCPVW